MNNELDHILLVREMRQRYRLEDYTDKALHQLNKSLNQVEHEIFRQWGKAGMRTEFSQGRAVALLEETRGLTKAVKASLAGDIAKVAGEVSAISSAYTSKTLSFNGKAANVKSVMLDANTLTTYWTKTPVGGHLLKEWVDKSFDGPIIDKIKQEIGTGMLRAESYDQIAKRMSEGFDMTKSQIDTLVRTTVRTAHVEALERVYSENKDLFHTLRWTAAINGRTCLLCASLEGNDYPLENHPPCPVHPRCRCTLLPRLKSLKELGLTNKEVEEYKNEENITSPTHQGYKGRTFLEKRNLTMGDWLRSLPSLEQKKYFGPSRFALLEAGIIKFADLVDIKQLRIKTLDELVPTGEIAVEVVKAAVAAVAVKPDKQPTPNELQIQLDFEIWSFLEALATSFKNWLDRKPTPIE